MYRVVLFLDNDHFRCIEATSIDYYYDDDKEKPAVEIVDGNNGDVYTSTSAMVPATGKSSCTA